MYQKGDESHDFHAVKKCVFSEIRMDAGYVDIFFARREIASFEFYDPDRQSPSMRISIPLFLVVDVNPIKNNSN